MDGADGTNASRSDGLLLDVVQGIEGAENEIVYPALAVGRASYRVPEPRGQRRPRSRKSSRQRAASERPVGARRAV